MKTVALFVCDPKCSVQSSNGIINALNHQYNIKLFSKNEVEDGFFDDIDMIIVPGGFGDSDSYDNLLKYNQDEIRKFIKNGGKYLGICMGAYWAGKHYFNILDGVEPVQYIKRPKTDTKRPHAKNIDVVWENNPMKMFFYDGCALVGNSKKFKSVATYANGDHMAIIQKNIGLIGCHPESEKFWYEGYSWLKGKYHEGIHHKLLLEFINELGKK
jgi:glutamine amidotransferase PdxT